MTTTDGPWEVKRRVTNECHYRDIYAGLTLVAVLEADGDDDEAIECLDGDAALIAAAPRMLALLPGLLCVNHVGRHVRSSMGCWGTADEHRQCAEARKIMREISAAQHV